MIYTKRCIYSLSLIISIIIFFLITIFINKIKFNSLQFQQSQVISLENSTSHEKENQIKNNLEETQIIQIVQTNKNEQIDSKLDWKIEIPVINLNAQISEGVSDEVIAETVGHFEESSKWEGNVALAAHNRGYECNYFQEIKNLKKGDIIIYSIKGKTRKYEVEINTVIKETDWSYIKNTKDNRITLITCEENKREYRRCIQGKEI